MGLNLNPDTEARLIALAKASGVSVDALLEQILNGTEPPQPQKRSSEEWIREFTALADSVPQTRTTPLPDEALSREVLNPDRV